MTEPFGLSSILATTSPIFILIAIGYMAVRSALIPRDGIRMLGLYVINFSLPALLFKALSARSLEEIVHPSYLLAYALGSLLVFGLGLLVGLRGRNKGVSSSTLLALGSSMSNSAFIGYPILLQLLGPVVAVPFSLTLIIENTVMLPLVLALAESGSSGGRSFLQAMAASLPRLLRNPILMSIVAGVLAAVIEVQPPAVAMRVVDMLASSSGPVSLFVIGGSLAGLKLRGMLADVLQVVSGKLLLHPACVWAMTLLFPMEPSYQITAVGLACVPMLSVYPIFGQKYAMEGTCAAALLSATVLSFVSIPVWIYLLSAA